MKSLPTLTQTLVLLIVAVSLPDGQLFGQESRRQGAGTVLRPDAFATDPQSSAAAEPESAAAKAALDQARQRLLAYQSIKAKLEETVVTPNRRFKVVGSYLQGRGADLKLRMEFQARLGSTVGSVLEVCDGQVLWTRHQIDTDVRISRRDVRQILQAAADNGLPENLITVELGFGGLPGLLASIEKSMQFDLYKEDADDGRKLIILEGGWRPEMLAVWQGNNSKAALPDYVPTRIRLYLDGETLFPRRILYLRRNAEKILRPLVSLDFSDVETNVPIDGAIFKFVPPEGIFPEDLTPQFLEQIKQRRTLGLQK